MLKESGMVPGPAGLPPTPGMTAVGTPSPAPPGPPGMTQGGDPSAPKGANPPPGGPQGAPPGPGVAPQLTAPMTDAPPPPLPINPQMRTQGLPPGQLPTQKHPTLYQAQQQNSMAGMMAEKGRADAAPTEHGGAPQLTAPMTDAPPPPLPINPQMRTQGLPPGQLPTQKHPTLYQAHQQNSMAGMMAEKGRADAAPTEHVLLVLDNKLVL
jgi:hypothetical protein